MALKDWKKQLNVQAGLFVTSYYWKNGLYKFIKIIEKARNYTVKIQTGIYDKIDKNFKTKSQALKFAKSYMRKH